MTLCTEKEAAEKWCPLVQFKFSGTSDTPSCNREPGMGCIGSRCMAWRFGEAVGPKIEERHPPNQKWDDDLPMISPVPIYGPRRGYCGAFGKDEE